MGATYQPYGTETQHQIPPGELARLVGFGSQSYPGGFTDAFEPEDELDLGEWAELDIERSFDAQGSANPVAAACSQDADELSELDLQTSGSRLANRGSPTRPHNVVDAVTPEDEWRFEDWAELDIERNFDTRNGATSVAVGGPSVADDWGLEDGPEIDVERSFLPNNCSGEMERELEECGELDIERSFRGEGTN